ncbi:MAG: hypothetical protein MK086_05675 [Flavobacteriales bacterium]|nr:hypothetical protein [Flavobacteriales bacterium]
MLQEEAKYRLSQYLQPYFDHKRYREKDTLRYERKTSFGSSVVMATLTGDHDMLYAKLFLGLRHDLVELTLTNTFGLEDYFQNSSYSLLLHWKYVDTAKIASALPCRNLKDLEAVGEMIIDFLDHKGFDFLNHYKKLSMLDHLYNDKFEKIAKWSSHSYLTPFRAMAVAKLMEREDYDTLFQTHRSYLESRGLSGPIIAKYEKTFAHLKKLSLN